MLLMFISVLVVAMPIGVIGGEFSEVYRAEHERKMEHQLKKAQGNDDSQLPIRSKSDVLSDNDSDSVLNTLHSHVAFPIDAKSSSLKSKEAIMERLAVINSEVTTLTQESHMLLEKLQSM